MSFPRFAKGRRPYARVKGTMTKLERSHAEGLELRKRAGEVLWWAYEGITLKLAPDTRYTPDFAVMLADGTLEIHETKGFMEEAAWVRLKLAAELFPFRFILFQLKKGAIEVTEVGGKEAVA